MVLLIANIANGRNAVLSLSAPPRLISGENASIEEALQSQILGIRSLAYQEPQACKQQARIKLQHPFPTDLPSQPNLAQHSILSFILCSSLESPPSRPIPRLPKPSKAPNPINNASLLLPLLPFALAIPYSADPNAPKTSHSFTLVSGATGTPLQHLPFVHKDGSFYVNNDPEVAVSAPETVFTVTPDGGCVLAPTIGDNAGEKVYVDGPSLALSATKGTVLKGKDSIGKDSYALNQVGLTGGFTVMGYVWEGL
ncbi:MAG: hypothetical protein Q9206_003915 [Seirophora lacunosa]